MHGFSFICLLVSLPLAPLGLPLPHPSLLSHSLLALPLPWMGGKQTSFRRALFSVWACQLHSGTICSEICVMEQGHRVTPPTIIDPAYSSASHVSPSPHAGLCLDKLVEDLLWCWKLPAPVSPASCPAGDHGVALWEGSSASPNPKHRGHLPVS